MKKIPPFLTCASVILTLMQIELQAQEADFSLPVGSGYSVDLKQEEMPGFNGKIVQARKDSGLTATIARGNAHLAGRLIDPLSGDPYINLVATVESTIVTEENWDGETATAGDSTFVEEGVINYSADNLGFPIEDGNFTDLEGQPDKFFPGLPGADDDFFDFCENGQNFSLELVTYLELPEGETVLGVRHDDAVEIAFHANDARDLFRMQAVGSDTNSAKTDRLVRVTAPEAGLYSVRILLAQWTGDATLEFFSEDENGDRVLVNDPEVTTSIKAWRAISESARPYVSALSPPLNDTGVDRDTAISVTVMNLSEDEVPVMKVNGEEIVYDVSEQNGGRNLAYQPTEPFGSGQTVNVEISYGAVTEQWSFVAKSGRKALLITGGGQLNGGDGWVATRLAQQFGFDVSVVSDAAVTIEDADGASLVYNSSTVNSGAVADVDFEELPIPLINVESASVDDFLMVDFPLAGKWANGPGGGHNVVIITDTEHPISAGIESGEQSFAANRTQYHGAEPPLSAAVIAWAPDNESRGVIYAIEEGGEILDEDGETVFFTHPARRVFFGFAGNDGAASFNEIGTKLFDAAVSWALASQIEIPFVVTDIRYDMTANKATVTWRSEVGITYGVSESVDLNTWIELDDGVESDGEATSYSANIEGPVRYYQIRKEL